MSADRLPACRTAAAWHGRIQADRIRAARNQTASQREVTAEVMARAVELGALAFALTGSTARRSATALSDLDYHVIGLRPRTDDLPGDIDVVAHSATALHRRLIDGDDFVQWTLRWGCILLDAGVLREGAQLVAERQLWPHPGRALVRLQYHQREVDRLLRLGDRDAAQQELRAEATTAARAVLLDLGEFPLSRAELPGQLERAGYGPLAAVLASLVHGEPDLSELVAIPAVLDGSLATLRERSAA